jgi:hypothetical protein
MVIPTRILNETINDVAREPTNVNVVNENEVVFTSSAANTPQE